MSGPVIPSGLAYTPFGLPQSGALPQPFGFAGELHSGDLLYLRARWYDPGSGTFPSVDPFEGWDTRPYSLHPYQYAYAAPTMWTDASGRFIPLAFVVVGGVVILVAVTFSASESTRMANTQFSQAPEELKDYFEHTIPTAIDVVMTDAPKGWNVVLGTCEQAIKHIAALTTSQEPEELRQGKQRHREAEEDYLSEIPEEQRGSVDLDKTRIDPRTGERFRPDIVNHETGEVIELKPKSYRDNPHLAREAQEQVDKYVERLTNIYGDQRQLDGAPPYRVRVEYYPE